MRDMGRGLIWFLFYLVLQAFIYFAVKQVYIWIPVFSYIVLFVVSAIFGWFNRARYFQSILWFVVFVMIVPILSVVMSEGSPSLSNKTMDVFVSLLKISAIVVVASGLTYYLKGKFSKA